MDICNYYKCTGCMTCVEICPEQAISIVTSYDGFIYPHVIENICVRCNKCIQACPANTITQTHRHCSAYECWSYDNTVIRNSSSGGMFTEIAKEILKNSGEVYGASLENNQVKHIRVSAMDKLWKLRGSKYVQSDVRGVYEEIKNTLNHGSTVLFSGTPCQVAGLKAYIEHHNVNSNNLYTIDLLCHGVPSPILFRRYLEYMEEKYKGKIVKLNFRDKKYSWEYFNVRMQFSCNKIYIGKYYDDPWLRIFLSNNALRESCYRCKYTSEEREGDITLGDYWGNPNSRINDEEGISLMLVNTTKGEKIFKDIRDNIHNRKVTMEQAKTTNRVLSKPYCVPDERQEFWNDCKELPFEEILKKWVKPKKYSIKEFILSSYNKAELPLYIKLLLIYSKIVIKVRKKINRAHNHASAG